LRFSTGYRSPESLLQILPWICFRRSGRIFLIGFSSEYEDVNNAANTAGADDGSENLSVPGAEKAATFGHLSVMSCRPGFWRYFNVKVEFVQDPENFIQHGIFFTHNALVKICSVQTRCLCQFAHSTRINQCNRNSLAHLRNWAGPICFSCLTGHELK
jgi:hypothetical protein